MFQILITRLLRLKFKVDTWIRKYMRDMYMCMWINVTDESPLLNHQKGYTCFICFLSNNILCFNPYDV